jgi:S1-C subfamily serine protease
MANLGQKWSSLYIIALSTFWALGVFSVEAQNLSTGLALDPAVLVSPQKTSDNHAGQNLETSLVNIKAMDAPVFLRENGKTRLGSEVRYGQGIIIDSAGIIATNRHIIGHARHIYVALTGGKIFEAHLLHNSETDLCLIKINTPFPLRAISFAVDFSDIHIGRNVIAIANTGLDLPRIRGGQITKIFKEMSSNKAEILEMNITLKPGDSGGPVLNEEGSLLGLIMGKKISNPSQSYAIASSRIQQEYYKYRGSLLN